MDVKTGLLGVGGAAFALALLEAEAVAVHLQDVDVVGEAIQQGARHSERRIAISRVSRAEARLRALKTLGI